MILAIDPGSEQSAYVLLSLNYEILEFGKVDNEKLCNSISKQYGQVEIAIEMIASYGMPVGAEVF